MDLCSSSDDEWGILSFIPKTVSRRPSNSYQDIPIPPTVPSFKKNEKWVPTPIPVLNVD